MSEEEIIKGITNIIYTCNDVIENKEWYNQEEIESAKEQLKFTEGLLNLYNKEKEQNRIMQAEFERLENIEDDTAQLKLLLKEEKEKNEALNVKLTDKICNGVEEQVLEEYRQKLKNSISKDKIREKIEELEKIKKKEEKTKFVLSYSIYDFITNEIDVLQELLEE